MKRLLIALALAGSALIASALPSVDEVQTEVAKGNYVHAEAMMGEVVAARPGSARAHYVYAEILAHNHRFDLAAAQVAQAKSIDPELKFAQPEKFRAFEQLLDREQSAARRTADRGAAPMLREPAPVERSTGVPGWVWGLGLVAVGVMLWRSMAARRPGLGAPSYAASNVPALPPGSPGYGPGYGGGYPAPGGGSGLLGTGLAVAGGVAAGMLAEKLLQGHQDGGLGAAAPGLREMAPGLLDDSGAQRELEQRPVDFGSGDGWGGGDFGGGDGGSSGGDGGW